MLKFSGLIILSLCFTLTSFAKEWEEYKEDIIDLERNIYKNEQELEVLIDKKKNTRDHSRIEQTLQRIVEIHAELISLRRKMDDIRISLTKEHPSKVSILDNYDSRMVASQREKTRHLRSPLSRKLDDLLIKVQLKYSTFIHTEDKTEDMKQVETILTQKKKKKREREADAYLRNRSKIKLVK